MSDCTSPIYYGFSVTCNDVVARAVDGEAGEGARGTQQLASQSLLRQVIDTHVVLCGHQQEGLARVEEHPLHASPVLAEGILGRLLAQLVDHHCLEGQPEPYVRCAFPPVSFVR